MNALTLLTLAANFLLWFALPCAVAGACYATFGSHSHKKRWFGVVGLVAAIGAVEIKFGIFEWLEKSLSSTPMSLSWGVGLFVLLVVMQTLAERAWSGESLWGRALHLSLVTTLGTWTCCFLLFNTVISASWNSNWVSLSQGGDWGYLMGTLLGPLSLSCFRGILPTARLRPGKDRHLEVGEEGLRSGVV